MGGTGLERPCNRRGFGVRGRHRGLHHAGTREQLAPITFAPQSSKELLAFPLASAPLLAPAPSGRGGPKRAAPPEIPTDSLRGAAGRVFPARGDEAHTVALVLEHT